MITTPRRVVDHDGGRKADLAAIHIAKAQLGLDDDSYRDLLSTVCAGVRSSAALDYGGRKRFLAHLRACLRASGAPAPARAASGPKRAVQSPLTPAQRKMWALWMTLADAGLVRNRTMGALAKFAARQTGVDRLEWLNGLQEALVIDSMKAWLKSRGEVL